jgi:hypothetical protein
MGRSKANEKGKGLSSSYYLDQEEEIVEEDDEEERASDEDYDIHFHTKRTKPRDPPARAQGRERGASGKPVPKKKTIGPVGARAKRASTGDEGGRYDDNIDLTPFEQVVVRPTPPHRSR